MSSSESRISVTICQMRRFLNKRRPLPDLLSAHDFYEPIDLLVDERLAARGFVKTKRATWVREGCQTGRPMFVIRHYKGKVSAPVWGYSLSYVPHFNNSGTKLYWHRTTKSARLDVSPFDDLERESDLNWFARREDHSTIVHRDLAGALDRANVFFESYRSTSDLLALFDRLQRYKGTGLGYWNYTNLPLAHSFTLRVTGDVEGGRRILDEFVRRMEISGSARSGLLRRFEDARAEPVLF